MKDYNLKLIKWLNDSYDKKGSLNPCLWVLSPSVFIRLIIRILLILTKRIINIFTKPTTVFNEGNYNVYEKNILRTSLINILLYRRPNPFESYIGSNQFKPKKIHQNLLLSLKEIQGIKLEFTEYQYPLVSIIIPVYNKVEYTFNCLRALKNNISSKISFEIIVINDNSSDATKEILEGVQGLKCINNEENIGFLFSSKKGAEVARGEYICFLNNDTEVQTNWLESLVDIFHRYPDAGIVGSMLIYPDNRLQEAGGIIWNDATGMNYGRFMNYVDPRFNFVRPVDYCSGASILIKKRDYETLQGFDEVFAPAYYEDTDLCFSVRNKLGKKVFYQPESKLIHHEGITSGTSTSSGAKRFQIINAETFKQKWQTELKKHLKDQPNKGAMRLCGKKTILIIDLYIPVFDKESGSQRLFQLIKIFKQLDYHLIFAPDNEIPEEPYTKELQQMGVEVLYRTYDYSQITVMKQIEERLPYIDIAWICRPNIFEKYIPLFKKSACTIIYDTIDLHYIRLKREAELFPSRSIDWQSMKSLEQKCGEASTLTIAITDVDKQTLKEMGLQHVEIIPNIHVANSDAYLPFEERNGILFIGGYNHTPNVDAALWLCNEIMPIVWSKYPDLNVTLLGSHPPEEVKKLAGPNVTVTGYIQDVSPYFKRNRIFVAPLTYGAGMKGKIGQSLEFSLPVVSTSVGVEGMNLKHDWNCLMANDTASFAEAIIQLYFDNKCWERISTNSHEGIFPFSPEYVKSTLDKIFSELPIKSPN